MTTEPTPTENGAGTAEPPASLSAHLGAIIDGRLHKLGRTLKTAYTERSVEAVHELRVVSRRLRAFGVTFEDVLESKSRHRLHHSLRRVAKAVGSLRDRDVQIALVSGRAEHASSDLERAGADYVLEQLEAQRAKSASKAKKRLGRLDA